MGYNQYYKKADQDTVIFYKVTTNLIGYTVKWIRKGKEIYQLKIKTNIDCFETDLTVEEHSDFINDDNVSRISEKEWTDVEHLFENLNSRF